MSCMYDPPGQVSLSCILDIVNDIRSGHIKTDTARKLLYQIDGGLAAVGQPVATLEVRSTEEVLEELEAIAATPGTQSATLNPELVLKIVALLMELWETIFK